MAITRRAFGWLAMLGVALLSGQAAAQARWQDGPAVKELYGKAKAEGSVTLWGTQLREVQWISKAFAADFPGIEVRAVGDNNIATTAIAEARGGRHQVDVFWHSLSGVAPLMERDLLAKVSWDEFGVLPANTFADGRLGVTNTMVYAFMYNPKLADRALLPKTWTDVLDPRLKGKMVVSDFLIPRLTGSLAMSMGPDKAKDLARSLRDKMDVLLTRAPREPMLQSGERAYSLAELDQQVRLWMSEGLSVDYVVPEPVTASQFVASVMAKAPRPHAARLLAGWLASDEGKAAREKAIFTADYRPGSKSPLAQKLLTTGMTIHFDDLAQVAERNRYFKEMAEIVSGQTP